VLAAGLAGCSGNSDDGSDTDGDDGSDTDGGDNGSDADGGDNGSPSKTETSSGLTGELAENGVSGLEIVDWTATEGDGEIQVTLTVENVSDQTTDAFVYQYGGTAYDSNGEDITAGLATGSTNATTIGPGETTTLNMYIGVFGSASNVARYELSLTCGSFGDGTYC
jgi:hypothetical protein